MVYEKNFLNLTTKRMAREYKYYHGTSTVFLEYILKNGLGGINPNLKFKNLELLKFLYGNCENTLFNKL